MKHGFARWVLILIFNPSIIANDSHFYNDLTYSLGAMYGTECRLDQPGLPAPVSQRLFPAALTTITIFPDRKRDSSPPPWSCGYGEYQQIVPAPP